MAGGEFFALTLDSVQAKDGEGAETRQRHFYAQPFAYLLDAVVNLPVRSLGSDLLVCPVLHVQCRCVRPIGRSCPRTEPRDSDPSHPAGCHYEYDLDLGFQVSKFFNPELNSRSSSIFHPRSSA
jgi:hypothetical protein